MTDLLEEARIITERERAEQFGQGKDFNVFYIQKTATDEVKICRFIREVLDPNGSHGQGAIFLKLFLEKLKAYYCKKISSKIRNTEKVAYLNSHMMDIIVIVNYVLNNDCDVFSFIKDIDNRYHDIDVSNILVKRINN